MPRGRPRNYGPKNPGKRFLAKNKKAMEPERKGELSKDVVRILERQLEKKSADVELAYQDVDRNAFVFQLSKNTNRNLTSQISRNALNGGRVGDIIKPTLLQFRYNAYFSTSATLTNPQHTFRIVIFHWNEDLAVSVPTQANVLEYTSGGVADYADITSPYLLEADKQNKYTILYDKTHNIGAFSQGVTRTVSIKPKKKIVFNRQSDAIGGTGHIYCFIVADDVTGGVAPQLFVQFMSRMWYIDA